MIFVRNIKFGLVLESVLNIRLMKWLNIVFTSLSFALFGFFMLGYIGPELTVYSNSSIFSNVSMRITYYFGGGIQELIKVYQSMPYHEYFAYQLGLYILQFLAFFGGFIGTIVFSIFGITNGVKTISENREVNIKYLLIVALCSIPHIFLTVSPNVLSVSGVEYISISEGWGIGLLQFAFVATFILLSAFLVVRNAIARKNLLRTIFTSVVIMFLGITTMSMFNDVVSFSNNNGSGEVGVFYALTQNLYNFSEGTTNYLGLPFIYGIAAILFAIASVTLSVLSLLSAIKEKYEKAIIFIGVNFVSTILAALFAAGSVGELISSTINPFVIISGSIISRCFLFIMCFVLLIVSLNIKQKENK